MTDRELLELAAKAAGMNVEERWFWQQVHDSECGLYANNANGTQTRWNPLTDDGDALRLAVALGIDVLPGKGSAAWTRAISLTAFADERPGADPYAATRRAIVRAAAEIGKATQ